MGSRILNSVAMVILGMLIVGGGSAFAGTESSMIRFPAGTFKIDRTTCRFAQPEADKALGRTWLEGRIAFAYEDGRHDAENGCVRARQDRIATCLVRIAPVTEKADHGLGKPGDELGVKAALAGLSACVATGTGVS